MPLYEAWIDVIHFGGYNISNVTTADIVRGEKSPYIRKFASHIK